MSMLSNTKGTSTKWNGRLLDLAHQAQSWSKGPEPHKNVGAAVASQDFREVGFGYGGPPAGYNDEAWIHLPKEERVELTVHAEVNAIINARRDLSGWTMAVTRFPCIECAKAIVQAGITCVVSVRPDVDSSWLGSQIKAYNLFRKMGVRVAVLEQTRMGWGTGSFDVGGTTL